MKYNSTSVPIFLLIMLLTACYSSNQVIKYDYSYLYDINQSVINPKYKIFHHSQDSSTLFYELNSQDILYERLSADSTMAASIKMKYTLFADRELREVLDSGSQNLANYGSNGKQRLLQNSVNFKCEPNKVLWMSVRFRDDNKDFNVINVLKVDKRLNLNNQFFTYKKDNQLLFDQRSISNTMTIEKSPLVENENFVMEMSNKEFSMTPPPFAQQLNNELFVPSENSFDFKFDNDTYQFNNPSTFNRFFPVEDSTLTNPVFYFGNQFPKLNETTDLIDPIRYISTSREYKDLNEAVNPKKGLDSFWLKLGKNEDNAKELLKEYYSRIESANQFFTSYKEGWKTDRGIIYVIYGMPSSIRKNAEKEIWVYGEENNVLSVQFKFYQPENSSITNHYKMVRNSDYKNNWYRQVDLWRQAKID